MRLAIRKWGNSLAVRIPHGIAQDADLAEGTEVEVTLDGAQVVITRVAPGVTLAALLSAITPGNLHGEVATGAPQGREAW